MKKIMLIAIILLLIGLAVYLLTSFVLWDFNPRTWCFGARFTAAALFSILSFVVAAAILTEII